MSFEWKPARLLSIWEKSIHLIKTLTEVFSDLQLNAFLIQLSFGKIVQEFSNISPFSLSLSPNLHSTIALKHGIFLPPKLLITLNSLCSASGMGLSKWALLCQWSLLSSLFFLIKSYVSIDIFHDSANPLLGLFPTEMHIYVHKKRYKTVHSSTVHNDYKL